MHGGGNPHFYLLPPLVSKPNLANERFLAGLAPDVHIRIKELARAGTAFIKCTNEAIDYLTASELPKLRVYGVLWFAGARKYATKVAAPCVYRFTVELGGTSTQPGLVLGFADVQLLNSKTIKNVISGDYIRLPEDWVLPFWFFIGEGAVSAATNPTGTACTPALDCKEAIVRASATVTQTIVTFEQKAGVSLPPTSLVRDGILRISEKVLAAPEGLAQAAASLSATGPECIPRSKMALPQFRDCYEFEFFALDGITGRDVFSREGPPVTVAMCVEAAGLTEAQKHILQIFFYHAAPDTSDRLDVLENASAAFLPCEEGRLGGNSNGTSPRGFAGVLRRGWYAAVSGLRALVGPRPLFASSAVINVGVGGKLCTPGTSCKLSTGTWGLPAELAINDGDDQSATVGTAVETAPSVIVTDTSGTPLEGAVVTFSVLYGGGSITAPLDTTGPDGIAQVGSWTLGATPGDNFLMASVAGATPDSVIFTATGTATTTTTLTTSAALAVVGTTLTLTATVSPAPPTSAEATVEFFDGSESLGSATVGVGGIATFTTEGFSLAAHSLRAEFAGASGFASSGSATVTQHMIQRFTSLSEFTAALGEASVATQDFQSFEVGTAVSAVISGVLNVTSTFASLEVFSSLENNILFGFDGTTRVAGNGRYDFAFVPSRNALGFDVMSQDPATDPAHFEVVTTVGAVTFLVSNPTEDESTPVFFGIIASIPLGALIVREGPEVGGGGNEEIGFDNFVVAQVSLP